jgi:hypothetical protein
MRGHGFGYDLAVAYRDDVEALFNRATILERELAQANEEIARLKGGWQRETTSPGIRQLRELPDPSETLARLIDDLVTREPDDRPAIPPVPDGQPQPRRSAVLERSRDLLGALDDERLVMVGALLEALVDAPFDTDMLGRLKVLVASVVDR